MSKITDSEVKHLAELSSLSLSDEELSGLKADLEGILAYVDELDEVDVAGVEPTYQVFDMENVWREDEEIDYGTKREQLLGLAKKTAYNSVEVPKVL